MGKTFNRDPDGETRDRKRDRNGWKAERTAARRTKDATIRGEFVGKRALKRAAKFGGK